MPAEPCLIYQMQRQCIFHIMDAETYVVGKVHDAARKGLMLSASVLVWF